ncbi:MAG: phage portal protein [Acidimicrobiia bacterium]|nr:phage portal protein [Acidimicrobiia bacterium]
MATVLPLPTSQAEPGSPEWWLHALQPKLEKRRDDMLMFDDYYAGRHPLPFLTNAAPRRRSGASSGCCFEQARSNFMRPVVDAAEERLKVEGFRLSASADEAADERSWEIWQANQLDAESQTGIVEAMVKGLCYLSVWAADEDGGYPVIAVEDPTETIVAYTPGSNYRRRDAAPKVWEGRARGVVRANVYLPDGISKFVADEAGGGSRSDWREWTDEPFVENPLRDRPDGAAEEPVTADRRGRVGARRRRRDPGSDQRAAVPPRARRLLRCAPAAVGDRDHASRRTSRELPRAVRRRDRPALGPRRART